MGSVGLGNNAKLGAFLNKTFQEGLDLGRCQINQALGVYVADPATTFRAGMCVMTSATTGLVQASDGTHFLGFAKWNHATALLAAVVDEAIVLTATNAIPLSHPLVSQVQVNTATGMLAAGLKTLTTDYTVQATNGTITRAGGGAITDGQTVYVSYMFQIAASDLIQTQGMNFWNTVDEVSQQDGRVTVITDAELLFTSQFDTSQAYAIGALVYSSVAAPGLVTSDSSSSALVIGRVHQMPSATDPYLGIRPKKGAV